jgi:hypothetical protein
VVLVCFIVPIQSTLLSNYETYDPEFSFASNELKIEKESSASLRIPNNDLIIFIIAAVL